ncbi:hypothetical protein [Mycobacteroides abscessus]|uniref:hypothetical protein n=1 Tax=Mycobacteroides abscessus TaxID=36809 RepID=UPI0009A8B2B2|nr:hypothetical protein [Mycobacteroides abscessus]SLB84932.1 Uncharacterised protein [Mycobacteroides abscessus subsp. abscessus]
MNKTTYAAATLLTLTALSGVGILVHGSTPDTQQDGDVTPRTVVMAAPPEEPCPYPYPMAICAPIPPAPLSGWVPEGAPNTEVAEAYAAAWNEIGVGR